MSQDGSWAEPEPTIRTNAQARELEQHVQNLSDLIGALVRKYGEPIGTSKGTVYRLALTDADLTLSGSLQTMMDPCSGALLIRFRPE